MDETPKISDEKFNEVHKKIVDFHEEVFKEMAKHEEATTKDVVSSSAVSPEILKEVKEVNEIKIPGKKDKKLTPRSFYCSTCRENFLEDKADKRPMGFERNEDGSITTKSKRFSIFCPGCAKFILIQDPETDAKIKDAIDKVGNK